MLVPGTTFAGHRIESEAGRGGMGVVYRAMHLALDIPVALKVLAPELAEDVTFRERFKRESRLAASIEHPHVLPVRHAGEEEGLLYIVMRWVEGPDLGRMIAEGLGPETAVRIVAQVADGLDAAHARGLVHRDVKPGNVLVERPAGRVHSFLGDFGLVVREGGTARLTQPGQWLGTLDYIAPEQIKGERFDGRADVYSLGCLLYHALSGEVPFGQEGLPAKMFAHLEQEPPKLPAETPAATELDPVIGRAMAKRAEDRFASAGELGGAALAAFGLSPSTTAEASPPPTAIAETRAATTAPDRTEVSPPGSTETGPQQPPAAGPPGPGTTPAPGPSPDPRPTKAPVQRRRRLAALAAVGAIAVVAAGAVLVLGGDDGEGEGEGGGGEPGAILGSGGDGGQVSDTALAAFRRDADAACTELERNVEDAFDAAGGRRLGGARQIEFLRERAAIIHRGVAELREVDPPDELAATYRAHVDARERFADALAELADAMSAGDQAQVESLIEEIDRVVERKMVLGEQLGLRACADVLPDADRETIVALAEDYVTGSDVERLCSEAITPAYLDSEFGGSGAICVEELRTPIASEATVVDQFGVDGVHATVTVAIPAGEVKVFFEDEDGWKLDGRAFD